MHTCSEIDGLHTSSSSHLDNKFMGPKRSKNQLRREKAKLRKLDKNELPKEPNAIETQVQSEKLNQLDSSSKKSLSASKSDVPKEEQNTKQEDKELKNASTILESEFASIFRKFKPEAVSEAPHKPQLVTSVQTQENDSASESEDGSDLEENSKSIASKKNKKNRVAISELKASTTKPQSVEWFDCDAPDPFLVVLLRTRLNNVDIPGHWQQKKDYLSAKKGSTKAQYNLPDLIRKTGISEMRNHDPESLKKLQRDRVQPKMNKLDIDYQLMHDAFFKHQTKPKLLSFGELYSEGREKTDQHRQKIADVKPGKISKELRAAIGMPDNEKSVPPWITLMQEFGKPPSYKHLIIPGVDVEYTNTGYRISSDEEFGMFDMLSETWGHLEEGEGSEPESDLGESREEEENSEIDEDKQTEKYKNDSSDEEKPQKIEITEYSRVQKGPEGPIDESKKASGELYKVLNEKVVESSNGLLNSNLAYDLSEK